MNALQPKARQRLLESATRLFAEHGKDDVSVRQIADSAGVTHGAIRYHFGSKDRLYRRAVDRLKGVDNKDEERARDTPNELLSRKEAEQALNVMVRRFVAFQARIGSDPIAAAGMLRNEVTQDGGPRPEFYDRIIRPAHTHMKHIIHSLRPDIEDDKTREILAFNLIFQCLMVRIGQGTILKLLDTDQLSEADVDQISATISSMTLAGLRTLKV